MQCQFNLAESRWLHVATAYLKKLYQNVWLPSHDLDHHLRVWNHCKLLAKSPVVQSQILDTISAEQMFLSCLFHDTGMIQDYSEKHGHLGVQFLNTFFQTIDLDKPEGYELISYAIEHHDEKFHIADNFSTLDTKNQLLRLVSTADDMDAFGQIGIYRYILIYTRRGIDIGELPARVIPNIEARFKNLENLLKGDNLLLNEQWKQFEITRNYFKSLNGF